MKPARFKIPKGCESITFEQIGNTLVTTFDVESEFKIGDVCVDENDVDPIIFILGGYDGKYPKRYADVWGDGSGCVIFPIARSYCEEMDFRHATESEKQVIFDALAKIGKMWDAEKLEITNLKYVPKVGDCVKARCFMFEFMGFDCDDDLLAPQHYIDLDEPLVVNNPVLADGINAYNDLTKITREELQSEFNKLGYEYDFQTHTAHKRRWRAKLGEPYWIFTDSIRVLKFIEQNDKVDRTFYETCNYFQTKEIAQQACDLFSESLKEFNENLK